MDLTITLVIIIIIIAFSSIRIVEQNSVFVIEFLGKFNRIMTAGLNFKIPLLERVVEKISLRQQNFAIDGKYPSQDKVIVDVSTNLIFTVNIAINGIYNYTYILQNRHQSIGAIIENSLRTYIAKETHEGILEKKDELALHIRTDLEKQFEEWGMIINSFQITNVNFPLAITTAMSEVVASQQLRKAAENKGEAVKIQAIKEAEAEKERKRLQGEGIALEREAIAHGLQKSVEIVRQATGQNSTEILSILTLTQYLDTLKSIGSTQNSKVIFMDTSVGKTSDLMKQFIASFESKTEN
ncbi:MAG: SPFH domain-containing protein [Candidatus Gracilibacteria bacterium]|nr:SPFH domain-containing protein [Candidatus Gracilibacteria bacterium]